MLTICAGHQSIDLSIKNCESMAHSLASYPELTIGWIQTKKECQDLPLDAYGLTDNVTVLSTCDPIGDFGRLWVDFHQMPKNWNDFKRSMEHWHRVSWKRKVPVTVVGHSQVDAGVFTRYCRSLVGSPKVIYYRPEKPAHKRPPVHI